MAAKTASGRRADRMEQRPLILKELAIDCGIRQIDLAHAAGVSKATIYLTVNRGYLPHRDHGPFMRLIEEEVARSQEARRWLSGRGLEVADIWATPDAPARKKRTAGVGARIWQARRTRAAVPGDPIALIQEREVEMVTQEALKHFKLFKNPFIDDVQRESDVFLSDEHRYIQMAMLDAARHAGFLAVIGECGSGKSVMRRMVVQELKKDGDVKVVYPQIIDKSRMNASAICDAIVMDLSEQPPKIKLEHKTRQVHKLLLERSKEGIRTVLIVEEAHDLNVSTLKYLKRFHELEDGFRKLLGIILIGQVELELLLDEGVHTEMREVIRRIQVAKIKSLNGNLKDYLALKFKRIGGKLEEIFSTDALAAMGARLTKEDRRGRSIPHCYPLILNNLAARAMNRAFEIGETIVTGEVVMKS